MSGDKRETEGTGLFKGPSEPVFAKDGSGRVVGSRGNGWFIVDLSEVDMSISPETRKRLNRLNSAYRPASFFKSGRFCPPTKIG